MSALLVIYGAYVVAVGSPGASTMAIMSIAMVHGRRPAIMFALGVVTVSALWGIAAATGMSALLHQFPELMMGLKIFGGVYLLWLAAKAIKSALSATPPTERALTTAPSGLSLYRRGLLIHLSNPKAVLAWAALFSLGLSDDAPVSMLAKALGGCVLLSATIFVGYAVVFSSRSISAIYTKARRLIELLLALVFAVAGVKLLIGR